MPEYPRSPFDKDGKSITPKVAGDVLDATIIGSTTPAAGAFTQVKSAKGADVASANALTLGADGNYFDITGVIAITSIATLGIGTLVTLHFDGILTLTHHATNLILPSGANITTAAGDEVIFIEYDTGLWRCISYTKADGTPINTTQPINLPAEAAYLPITNPAALVEVAGATVYAGWSHADFDDTTSESIVWRVPVPDYDLGNITVTAYGRPATTPGGAVTAIFDIFTIGLATSENFNTAVTVDTGVDITFNLNTTELQTDICFASNTIDPVNVAADDILVLELKRNVTDTLTGDFELFYVLVEFNRQ